MHGTVSMLPQFFAQTFGVKSEKPKSPCIDVCEFSRPKGWCVGCGRTREETVGWKKMKPYEVNVISKELKRRTTKMNHQSDH